MKVPVTRCKSCGARVFFAFSERGNIMIVDAEPVEPGVTLDRHEKPIPRGNLKLADWNDLDQWGRLAPRALVNTLPPQPAMFGEEERRYVSHHATCPQSDDWKMRRGA